MSASSVTRTTSFYSTTYLENQIVATKYSSDQKCQTRKFGIGMEAGHLSPSNNSPDDGTMER